MIMGSFKMRSESDKFDGRGSGGFIERNQHPVLTRLRATLPRGTTIRKPSLINNNLPVCRPLMGRYNLWSGGGGGNFNKDVDTVEQYNTVFTSGRPAPISRRAATERNRVPGYYRPCNERLLPELHGYAIELHDSFAQRRSISKAKRSGT